METIKTRKARIANPNAPEGLRNPAVGGVYIFREDPTRWIKVTELNTLARGETPVTMCTYGGVGKSVQTGFDRFMHGLNARTFIYYAAGSPEAKEAVRDPKARLRDLLLKNR
jgi:hypothetical protein